MPNYIPKGSLYRKLACHRKENYSKVKLVIAVKGGVLGAEQRMITRNTFGALAKKKYPDVAIISFLAKTKDQEEQKKGE